MVAGRLRGAERADAGESVTVLTPAVTVAVIAAGYAPSLHPSPT